MNYAVVIQPHAEGDIESAYRYIRNNSSKQVADRWLLGMADAVNSLHQIPNRCGLARESREFEEPIRQLLFGRRQYAYRIIFVVRGMRVLVLRVLHGAREALPPEELMP